MMFFVVMGVCGCGKTTIGNLLAKKLDVPFNDADDFHSAANKQKMNQGIPLTDDDRLPWLVSIHNHMKMAVRSGQFGVVACSALKKKYRRTLLTGNADEGISLKNNVVFIYLKGSDSVIKSRMMERRNHFMPVDLLNSQLIILEEPDAEEKHFVVNIDFDEENILAEVLDNLHKLPDPINTV